MEHELKTWPKYFQSVVSGEKTFELRENDRDFKVGDILHLKEWEFKGWSSVNPDQKVGEYTGNSISVLVSYILPYDPYIHGLMHNSVIMSITPLP